jgi:hypothetical protein
MSDSPSIFERFQSLPRVLQWAALAAVGFALFYMWLYYIDPQREDWDRAAEAIEGRAREVRSIHAAARDLRKIETVVTSLGPVDEPSNEREGAAALLESVNSVLKKHGASNPSFSFRSKGNLPKTALTSVARGKRIERLNGELKFDANPKTAMAVIADLEASPDVEAVSSVRMLKEAQGKVKVHLIIESWVLASEAPKGEAP